MNFREPLPTADNSTNFNRIPDADAEVGTTLDNLKAAVAGETGASAKYAAYAEACDMAGYAQAASLFRAASAAEQVHIRLEAAIVEKRDPDYVRPTAGDVEIPPADLALIDAANGEIWETTDMYPGFIAKAIEEGDDEALVAFTRAKLAEGVHAEKYLEAYNNLDALDDDKYYVCPGCGYIHKGSDIKKCPICGAAFAAFKEY